MIVAVAIIVDTKGHVLLTQRPIHKVGGGLWEFPGGKLEQDESAEEALCREIKEEVGLNLLAYKKIGEVQYNHTSPILLIYLVTRWQGEAQKCEDQLNLCWTPLEKLSDYDFPKANQEIIMMIEQYVKERGGMAEWLNHNHFSSNA